MSISSAISPALGLLNISCSIPICVDRLTDFPNEPRSWPFPIGQCTPTILAKRLSLRYLHDIIEDDSILLVQSMPKPVK